jgi:hypothetical protein
MSAVTPVNAEGLTLEQSTERLVAAALKVKAERDEFQDALIDLAFGANMLLDSKLLTGAFDSYAREVRRVAREALAKREAP